MNQATQTMTLGDFLRARIAEDEAAAAYDGPVVAEVASYAGRRILLDRYGHPVVQTRQRLEAEARAKRRIIWAHEKWCDGSCSEGAPWESNPHHVAYYWSMAHIAAVYADHPDYRDEWKP